MGHFLQDGSPNLEIAQLITNSNLETQGPASKLHVEKIWKQVTLASILNPVTDDVTVEKKDNNIGISFFSVFFLVSCSFAFFRFLLGYCFNALFIINRMEWSSNRWKRPNSFINPLPSPWWLGSKSRAYLLFCVSLGHLLSIYMTISLGPLPKNCGVSLGDRVALTITEFGRGNGVIAVLVDVLFTFRLSFFRWRFVDTHQMWSRHCPPCYYFTFGTLNSENEQSNSKLDKDWRGQSSNCILFFLSLSNMSHNICFVLVH